MKILLVDDSFPMRVMQKKSLEDLGFSDVREAMDGVQALREIERDKPDLVLMDWMMPNMSGIDALKSMKNNPEQKDIPVVMVTSLADTSHMIEAIKAGAANYLIKPFTENALKEKLKPYLH